MHIRYTYHLNKLASYINCHTLDWNVWRPLYADRMKVLNWSEKIREKILYILSFSIAIG